MKKHVTLLCRGKSLDDIKSVPNTDHCVLVNSFGLPLNIFVTWLNAFPNPGIIFPLWCYIIWVC